MPKDRFFLLDAGASRSTPTPVPLPPGTTLKAGPGDTEGRFSLLEEQWDVGTGTPAQVPNAMRPLGFDTFLYVREGDLGLDIGDQTHHLTGGMCALVPRGLPHALRNLGGADSAPHALQLSAPGVPGQSDADGGADVDAYANAIADAADGGAARRFFVLRPGEARPGRIPVPPAFSIKARTADTAGLFSFLEVTVAQPIPRHTHHVADEGIYVLDGALNIDFDGDEHIARPGQFVLLPRGVPHAIRPGSTPPPRVLQISSPGGWECVVETLIEHRTEVSRGGRLDPAALNRYTRQYHVTYEEDLADGQGIPG
ncbi:cupin domain-containing protein [Streptomyces yunnanensis]|uniref:Cupin domain-containing protein n=1 Tax=Streptomyces yunnanensis TaxID=156453 RepID=A0A9X8MQU6_9ACTN|nr:cupin domain-containing protein [Streptomyces yunnanensis]SHL48005.1 Cupin domain-containing protein [Streptomyces yunnanensis]